MHAWLDQLSVLGCRLVDAAASGTNKQLIHDVYDLVWSGVEVLADPQSTSPQPKLQPIYVMLWKWKMPCHDLIMIRLRGPMLRDDINAMLNNRKHMELKRKCYKIRMRRSNKSF
jgi:hypothetical protein